MSRQMSSSSDSDDDFDPGQDMASSIPETKVFRRSQYRGMVLDAEDSYIKVAEQYCGIRNQGATCYMNSVLQALFHLPVFRKMIYQIPLTDCPNPEKSIVWNLQRLFAALQTGHEAASTKDLTKAFGWDDDDVSLDQDTHEFIRVILTSIEEKLKGTSLENAIKNLFSGKLSIEYQFGDSVRVHEDDFYDLPLIIKDCSNLRDAISRSLEIEMLEGENQYFDETTNQRYNGIRRSSLVRLPSVLFFYLQRFEFVGAQMTKINSRFEFPLEIDMSEFIVSESAHEYELYGVLVHSGSGIEGHFRVFLRTEHDDRWFEFNDSTVSFSNAVKAMDMNFGGDITPSNAYMLIYVRKNEIDSLFCEVPDSMIPFSVEQLKVVETRKSTNSREKELVRVSVWTEASIRDSSLTFEGNAKTIEISGASSFYDLYQRVSVALNMKNLRLWYASPFGVSALLGCRRDRIISEHLYGSTLFAEDVKDFDPDLMLVFCAFYQQEGRTDPMHYMCSLNVKKTDQVLVLGAQMCTLLNIPITTTFITYLRVGPSELIEIDDQKTFRDLAVSNGAFFVFQFPTKQHVSLGMKTHHVSGVSYFDMFPAKVPFNANEYFALSNSSFAIDLSVQGAPKQCAVIPSSLQWPDLKEFVAHISGHDYNSDSHTMLFYKGTNTVPLDESAYRSVGEAFSTAGDVSVIILDNEVAESSPLRAVVSFSTDTIHIDRLVIRSMPMDATVGDLIECVRKANGVDIETPLRCLSMKQWRVKSICEDSNMIRDLSNPFRVEIVPEDQLMPDSDGYLISVEQGFRSASDKEFSRAGSPFLMQMKLHDTSRDLAQRIMERLQIDSSRKNDIRLYYVEEGEVTYTPVPKNELICQYITPMSRVAFVVPSTAENTVRGPKVGIRFR